jgi:hypothetical protein
MSETGLSMSQTGHPLCPERDTIGGVCLRRLSIRVTPDEHGHVRGLLVLTVDLDPPRTL